MSNSKNCSVTDKLGAACDKFSSTLKTIHLFDQFIEAGILNIPEDEIEGVRNNVKTPLTIMLSCFQNDIDEIQNELKEKYDSLKKQRS